MGVQWPLSAWVGATRVTLETSFLTSHVVTGWLREEASAFTYCLPRAPVPHAQDRVLLLSSAASWSWNMAPCSIIYLLHSVFQLLHCLSLAVLELAL